MNARHFLQFAGPLPEPMLLVSGDGIVRAANPAAKEILGVPDLADKRLLELVSDPPERVNRYLRLWSRTRELTPGSLVWRGGAGSGCEVRCEGGLLEPAGDGTPALLLVRCRPREVTTRGFLALNEQIERLAREIGERRRAERQLQAQREWLTTTLSSIGDAVIVTDPQGRVTFLNRVSEQLTRWSPEEATGQRLDTVLTLLDEHTREPLESPVPKALLERGAASQPALLVARDRTEFAVEGHGAPIRDERGNVLGVVLVFRDVTERRQADEQLRQAQKLESLGLLAGGIAHDFNNLLTGILGNASLALEILPHTSPARTLLDQLVMASERAADLTRQLLAYAGRGRFLVRLVDLSELVREISGLVRTSMPRSVDLKLELAVDLPPVEADPIQLQQVIMNLVINGAEAIGEERSGAVLIRSGARQFGDSEMRGAIAPEGLPPGNYVWLEVSDDGCGMDEVTRTRIFDPFFTTKFTGRGLGLAATLGIVRSHRGAIAVRSTPGVGTTFQVLFPAVEQALAPRQSPAPVARSAVSGTILVVDDEEVVRRTAKAGLERHGFQVLLAEDGRRAVELFREHASAIALVLLDMNMPVLSGEQAVDMLKQIRPDVKVILSSGYSELEALQRFSGKGLAGFLQKPYSAASLVDRVTAVLGQPARGSATARQS